MAPTEDPTDESGTATDLPSFAVQLRRMNGELNRVVHAFAAGQDLHATDVQALSAILDADEPRTPGPIFLMSRVREESVRHGTREGALRGLTTTGGVITSAGVVLAATFAALGVIPFAFLLPIAFIVAFGVLLDTLVVRSLLVPALIRDIGDTAWWPGRV